MFTTTFPGNISVKFSFVLALLVGAIGFLMFPQQVAAQTILPGLTLDYCTDGSCPQTRIYLNATLDKNTYAPGEIVTQTVTASSDDYPRTGCITARLGVDGANYQDFFTSCVTDEQLRNGITVTKTYTLPSNISGGSHTINFAGGTSNNVYAGKNSSATFTVTSNACWTHTDTEYDAGCAQHPSSQAQFYQALGQSCSLGDSAFYCNGQMAMFTYECTNPACSPATYVCTGLPANATGYPAPDNTGLSVNTAYTYSASDTAAKCQYGCASGYTWNGSSCVSGGTPPTPTYGSCASTHYNCSGGSSSGGYQSGSDYYWNCVGSASTVSCAEYGGGGYLPDLIAGAVSPNSATAGVPISLSSTVQNQGYGNAGGFTNLFQRATDSVGTGAVSIGTSASGAMASAQYGYATLSYAFPSAGTYYVRVCADTYGAVTEAYEGNNCGPWSIVNVASPPATAPYGVIDSVSSGVAGFSCGFVSGWAFDQEKSNHSIDVHVYRNGPGGWIGYNIGATAVSRPDVNAAYGISGTHGYNFQIPGLSAGTYTLDAYGIGVNSAGTQDGVNSLLANSPFTFTCTAPTNGSSCGGITGVPTSVVAGGTFTASITMNNTGTTNWTSGGAYRLGSENGRDNWTWGTNRIELPFSPVNAGNSATFNRTFTAPTTPGTYPFSWAMVQDGVEWFGPVCSASSNVTVTAPVIAPVVTITGTTQYGGTGTGTRSAWYGEGTPNSSTVVVSWSAANNPTSCSLYKDGVVYAANLSYPSVSGYAVPAVTASVNYYVTCTNTGGTGTSNTVTFVPPPVPTNAAGSCNTTGTLGTVTWTAPPGYSTFYTRGNQDGVTYAPMWDENFVGTTKTFTTTPGSTYYWWIHTKDTSNGNWSTSPAGSFTCTVAAQPNLTANTVTANPIPAPGVPTTLTANILNNGAAGVTGTFNNIFQFASDINGTGAQTPVAGSSITDLAQSQTKTTTYTWTPSTAGTYFVRACADNSTAWAGSIIESNEGDNCSGAPFTAITAGSDRDATCVSMTGVPNSIQAGATFTAQVTMRNTGINTWTISEPNPYRLGSQSPQDNGIWGLARVDLPSGSVAPNTNVTFTLNARAPSAAGTYNFDWKMLQEGVAWFGETCPGSTGVDADIDVTDPTPTADLQAISPIDQGQASTLSWTSTNATSCTGIGFTASGTSGNVSTGVLSAGTYNYQITCTGPGGTSPADLATVIVRAPSASISATPGRVTVGQPSRIDWSSSQVNSCVVSGPGLSSTALSGSQQVTVNTQATYTITCQTNGSPVTRSVIVNVLPDFQEF
jgi:hypothetical protein